MIPRRRKASTVEVGWMHPETEEDFRVVCTVSPGFPGRGPTYSSGGEPPEPPEVEILRVVEDKPGGVERPDLLPLVEADLDSIEGDAIEDAEERHIVAYEYACELAADARRES